jgi:hypothetical protein
MSLKNTDWKFFVSLLVGVLGVGASIYWPFADLRGHGLTLSLVSSASLQPSAGSPIQDLQVTLNGSRIENPYLSSLTIINSGSKPILSSDFDTPLGITVQGQATLVTAQISGSTPKGIPVDLKVEDGRVKILPFLSNPGDEVNLVVITSGIPNLIPSARIAGVREIVVQDLTQVQAKPLAALAAGLIAATCFFLYTYLLSRGRLLQRLEVGPWIRVPTLLCMAICGTQALQIVVVKLAPMIALGVVAVVLAGAVGVAGGMLAVKAANRNQA